MEEIQNRNWEAKEKGEIMMHEKFEDKNLIDAMNLIGTYVADNLPEGWRITITLEGGEGFVQLHDPVGNEIDVIVDDESELKAMCDVAELSQDAFDGGRSL